MSIVEIKVPDIGGHENVDIIAVEVKAGDTIAVDDTLITLETDKATMDVPADAAGVVKEVKVKVGDKISEGGVILTVETGAAAAEAAPAPVAEAQPAPAAAPAAAPAGGATVQVAVPDIGGHTDVDVIAVEVKVGDTVAEDDTLITLETDKATMDVPCTAAGVVKAVFLKVGDKVSEGTAIYRSGKPPVLPPLPLLLKPLHRQQHPLRLLRLPPLRLLLPLLHLPQPKSTKPLSPKHTRVLPHANWRANWA
ncbi:dihydrolipoamide acetyltransferase [Neisseria sicca ATCC 29256]|uniref:Dihydrolipoamide acetyltransferase n=1 Tax=Neisseria sicca ATCC 29256 TaxID=547045 RepID=C6M314_NEISI|nr:dihydrolipoamide acetyltransferase [Neisseria sicca ATCC 29256]